MNYKFRVGEQVACIKDDPTHQNSVSKIEKRSLGKYSIGTNQICDHSAKDLISIAPVEKAKYALVYEKDVDPTEYFFTQSDAEKRIECLLKRSDVKANSIYLIKLEKVFKVKKNSDFVLEEVK